MRTTTAAVGSSVFFLAAPTMVAGAIPWGLTRWHGGHVPAWWLPVQVVGALLVAAAVGVLLNAFWRFVVEGRGTPAPVAPTDELVVGGLYRHVRNPMYVAVVSAVIGQALLLARPMLAAYAVGLGALFAAFVHWYEEPALHRQHGDRYERYRQAVPAWRPRLRPWQPDRSDSSTPRASSASRP
jgi:protein-S-isoprenylcysteine O-methyltransferase Ste14